MQSLGIVLICVVVADLWAHSASYLAGFVGGFVVVILVWRSRGWAAAA